MANTTFNFDLKKQTQNIKKNVKSINQTTLTLTEELVEGTLETGAKWQKVLAKAMKTGVVLFGNQQEMALDAIEGLKDQYIYGSKRVKKLVSLSPKAKKAVKVDLPSTKAVKEAVAKTAKAVRKNVTAKAAAVKKTAPKKVVVKATTMDDLTVINGVGKKIANLLNAAGIKTYKQLANADLKSLRAILKNAGPSYEMHNPTPWRREAKAIISK